MHRFFVEPPCAVGAVVALPAEEAQHAFRVLRLAPGEAIELIAEGRGFAAELTCCDKQGAQARITAERSSREPDVRVTLCMGLCKADKMELIIQKATELGVYAIQPLALSRCVMKVDKHDPRITDRWPRIAREAVKQCARTHTPRILPPATIAQLGALWAAQQAVLVPWECAKEGSLPRALAEKPTDIALVIGPEGGIAADEMAELSAFGGVPVTLGPRILRAETAAIAATAAIMALTGAWEGGA